MAGRKNKHTRKKQTPGQEGKTAGWEDRQLGKERRHLSYGCWVQEVLVPSLPLPIFPRLGSVSLSVFR
jgi:hypothetical protein